MPRRHLPLTLIAILALAMPGSAYQRPGAIERLSVSPTGEEGDRHAYHASMTADARLVAFGSQSTLLPGDTNEVEDIFLRDRATGALSRVSVAADGTEGNGTSYGPSLTPDGRYLAFTSHASNLVAGDIDGFMDVFVKDLQTGTVEMVSVSSSETLGNRRSFDPAISADGRYVAFISSASNLVPGDTNGFCDPDNSQGCDVFVRDRVAGTTERVSVAADGTQGNGPSGWRVDISADGRYVSFYSFATTLVPRDMNGRPDIFVKDRQTGGVERVSVASDGSEADAGSTDAALSADGRVVAFSGVAANLVPADGTIWGDVFVHDRDTGRTERVSVSSTGAEGNSDSNLSDISDDGRYVLLSSLATNLTPEGTGGAVQTYIHDRATRTTELVSADAEGLPAGPMGGSTLSPDGRIVSMNGAGSLLPDDTNGTSDIYLRDRGPANGIGGLSLSDAGGTVRVEGWATFSPASIASVADPATDGGPVARRLGVEMTAATILQRPELGDLLLRVSLAELPGLRGRGRVPGRAGLPGTVWSLRFRIGTVPYEVRAAWGAPAPSFGLWRCDAGCISVGTLAGGLGSTGEELLVSVPTGLLPAGTDALQSLTLTAGLGDVAGGCCLQVLDEIRLGNAALVAPAVALGTAPAGTPEDEVGFAPVAVTDGRFAATLGPLGPGAHDIWARACLGATCGSTHVTYES